MKQIEQFLNEHKSVSNRKVSDTVMKVYALGENVKLLAHCSDTQLEAKLTSRSGKTLYSVNENYVDEATTLDKLKEVVDMYDSSSQIKVPVTEDTEDDDIISGNDKDSDKEFLLSDVVPESEVNVEPVESETDTVDNINSIADLKMAVLDLATRSNNLVDMFDADDVNNRSIVIGLVAGLYGVAEDLADFEEDLAKEADKDKKKAKESVSVPAKTDYIDLACSGISQACTALKDAEKYSKILEVLKDIKSELKTN